MFGLIILVQSKTNLNENCADVFPRRPSPLKCVGCTPAKLGQYPWQVALVERDVLITRYFCGGTLISIGLVLTAAHCIYHPKHVSYYTVLLGHIDKENESQITISKGMIKTPILLC